MIQYKRRFIQRGIALGMLCTLVLSVASAQQEPIYTNFTQNTLNVNPAYAGSRDALTLTVLHRSQWVGVEGAPMTQTLTLHTPLISERLGFGFSAMNDKIGPSNTSQAYIDLAYRQPLGKTFKLAIGIKGGGRVFQNNLTELNGVAGDVAFAEDENSRFLPNVGAGLYVSSEGFYFGFSAPRLLKNNLRTNATSREESLTYHVITGGVIPMGALSNIKLNPAAMVQVESGSPVAMHLMMNMIIKDKFEIGGMWRSGDAVGGLIGWNILPSLKLGYSFDYSYGFQSFTYNGGSHEAFLRFDWFKQNRIPAVTPRYF